MMTNNKKAATCCLYPQALTVLMLFFVVQPGLATEGGGSVYPMGADNYLSGIMPPPGFYGLLYGQYYTSDSLRGNDGRKQPVDFHLRTDAVVPRLIWVSDATLLGGAVASHIMLPWVDVRAHINGDSERKQGVGDLTFGSGVGYHYSPRLHAIYAVDITAPTGGYHQQDLVNLGRNYWMFEPVMSITYTVPRNLTVDAKIMYDFNTENPATNYRSGQEFHIDYSLGWEVAAGWTIGLGGYFYRQITDDKQNGERIKGNKGRAFAIGPSLKYSSTGGWFFTAKWQQESDVRNRAQGDAYWLRFVMPL
jgi:hypothetical protein